MLISLFLVSGLFNILSNSFLGSSCLNEYELSLEKDISKKCFLNWVTLLSVGNKMNEDKLVVLQDILNFVSLFIIMFVL